MHIKKPFQRTMRPDGTQRPRHLPQSTADYGWWDLKKARENVASRQLQNTKIITSLFSSRVFFFFKLFLGFPLGAHLTQNTKLRIFQLFPFAFPFLFFLCKPPPLDPIPFLVLSLGFKGCLDFFFFSGSGRECCDFTVHGQFIQHIPHLRNRRSGCGSLVE